MRLAIKIAILACIVSGYGVSAYAQGTDPKTAQTPDPSAPYLNPALPTDQRLAQRRDRALSSADEDDEEPDDHARKR